MTLRIILGDEKRHHVKMKVGGEIGKEKRI